MKPRRSFAVAILAGILLGCLLWARPAGASNSISVSSGDDSCGQGGGWNVSSGGTYTADAYPFVGYGAKTPAVQSWCLRVQDGGSTYGLTDMVNASMSGGSSGTVSATNVMSPQDPTAPHYFIGWYVIYKLGYWDNGVFIVWCSSVTCFVDQVDTCFAAGMPVLTPEGSKAIEQIRVGDLVLSSPEKVGAGQIGARRIKEVTRGRAKLVGITVGGHLIQASREHPFFVRGESWTSASSLSVGDLLRTHDGRWVQIEEVAEGPESLVYNVRVEENRTYFVGSGDWGFSLWVRDSCGITKQRRALPSLVATEAARD